MRATSATQVGINRGPATACAPTEPDTWVLAFWLALGRPPARRIEVWLPVLAVIGGEFWLAGDGAQAEHRVSVIIGIEQEKSADMAALEGAD